MKKSWGSNTYIWQNRPQSEGHSKNKEGHFIILKGLVQQEDITLINIDAPNRAAPKYIKNKQINKKLLEDINREIDNNTNIVGNFNTPLTSLDKSSRQKNQHRNGNPQGLTRSDGLNQHL